MEIFINLWNNWCNVEKISYFGVFTLLFVFFPLLVKILTKDNRLTLLTIFSLLASAIITVLALLVFNIVFNQNISNLFLLTPPAVLFVNILNIGTCIGYHIFNNNKKDYSILSLRIEHLRDSVQLSVFIALLFTSLSVFLSSTYLVFIITTGALCLSTIWINYTILYKLVR